MNPGDVQDEDLAALLERGRHAPSPDERLSALEALIRRYDEAGPEVSREVRRAFAQLLQDQPEALNQDALMRFWLEHVGAEDLAGLRWRTAGQAVDLSEMLERRCIEDEAIAQKVADHIRMVLRQAMQQFEARGDMESAFEILATAPQPLITDDAELLRLRHRAHLYERRRVRRNRRWLHGYLLVQVVLIFVVFPLLFINAENGRIQQDIENATQVNLPEGTKRQYLSFGDGLYWSIITAGSIGYGDITPVTNAGKVLASILGVSGVITVGVVAGLVLDRMTPRRLE